MPAGRLMYMLDGSGNLVPIGENNPLPTAESAGGAPAAAVADDNDDVAVSNAAVQLLAANADRKSALIQNVGAEAMRVTTDGSAPTATHGKRLAAGESLVLTSPYCPVDVVRAIREGATDTSANASEVS